MSARIPFVVVPHPFVVGEYRITPSCIVAGTAAITGLSFLLRPSFFAYFLMFHLLYILRKYCLADSWLVIGLHMALRNDSIKSRARVAVNEKLKEFVHSKYDCFQKTQHFVLRSCWHFQHTSFCLKLGAPHYALIGSICITDPHFQSLSSAFTLSSSFGSFGSFGFFSFFSSSTVLKLSLPLTRSKKQTH